jgi:hypothetical protein
MSTDEENSPGEGKLSLRRSLKMLWCMDVSWLLACILYFFMGMGIRLFLLATSQRRAASSRLWIAAEYMIKRSVCRNDICQLDRFGRKWGTNEALSVKVGGIIEQLQRATSLL